VIDKNLIPVISTKVVIASGCFNFYNAITDLK
jgi:hypothetical protein